MGSKTLSHKVGPNEDIKDLSGGDCDAPNLIDCVMCVGVDESHIGYLLGKFRLYEQLQGASIVTSPFEV